MESGSAQSFPSAKHPTIKERFLAALRREIDADLTLWEHQRGFLNAYHAHLDSGQQSGLGVMATGTGKTRTYAVMVKAALAAGLKTAIFANTIDLTNQNGNRILYHVPTLESRDQASIHSKGVYKNSPEAEDALLHLITYANVRRALKGAPNAVRFEEYDFIIFDEADELTSRTTQLLLSTFLAAPDKCLSIAATATPMTLETHFGQPFYTLSLPDAMERGIVAKAEAYLVSVDTGAGSDDEQETVDSYSKEERKFLNRQALSDVVLDLYWRDFLEAVEKGGAAPIYKVFATSVSHSIDLAKQFNALFKETGLPFRADYLAGVRRDQKTNKAVIDATNRGEIQLLISNKFAVRGIDIPRLSTAVMLYPALDPTASQRIGRVLRLYAAPGLRNVWAATNMPPGKLALALMASTQVTPVKLYDVLQKDELLAGTRASDILGALPLETIMDTPQRYYSGGSTPTPTLENLENVVSYEITIGPSLPSASIYYTAKEAAELSGLDREFGATLGTLRTADPAAYAALGIVEVDGKKHYPAEAVEFIEAYALDQVPHDGKGR
jgi:superfamily II DNA or RNA helicase